jgi:hypothetical protein
LLNLLRGTASFAVAKGKPVLVTEFGGSPHADSMGNLIKQAHLGVWTGFFCGSSVAPLFWWFALVDEKDLYGIYPVLARFMEGEDRRGMSTNVDEISRDGMMINELRGKKKILVWGFDTEYYLSSTENLTPETHADFVLTLRRVPAGTYDVEYWDFERGGVAKRETVKAGAGQALKLSVPPFRKDFAMKLRAK